MEWCSLLSIYIKMEGCKEIFNESECQRQVAERISSELLEVEIQDGYQCEEKNNRIFDQYYENATRYFSETTNSHKLELEDLRKICGRNQKGFA